MKSYIEKVLIHKEVPETHIKINGITIKIFSDWDDFARTNAKSYIKQLRSLSEDELIKRFPEAFIK